jgi:hypothetical protein
MPGRGEEDRQTRDAWRSLVDCLPLEGIARSSVAVRPHIDLTIGRRQIRVGTAVQITRWRRLVSRHPSLPLHTRLCSFTASWCPCASLRWRDPNVDSTYTRPYSPSSVLFLDKRGRSHPVSAGALAPTGGCVSGRHVAFSRSRSGGGDLSGQISATTLSVKVDPTG